MDSGVTFEKLWEFVRSLPETEVGTSYRTPAFKVKGKLIARMWEDDVTLVLLIDFETKEMLLKTNPEVFFQTDHYAGYPAVLARLPFADYKELCELLEESWRQKAPVKVVNAYDLANL